MRIRLNIKYVALDLLLLLPITTLFQGFIPVINRALFAVVIAGFCAAILYNKFKTKEIVVFLMFLSVYVYSFFITQGMAENINEYFYLLFFIVYYMFALKNQDFFKRYCEEKKGYILNVVRIWCACVAVSLFFPSSYRDGAFYSFTENFFRSATAATFILSLILVIVAYNKKYVVYAIFPMICILGGAARTYLFVGMALCLCMYYMVMPSRKAFWLTLIPVSLAALIIISNSSIMEKIVSSLHVSSNAYYKDPIIKFTSGRSLFWEADVKAYWEGSWFEKLFGFGYNFVYDINERAINSRIWAHNDFINILLGYGLLGLICYLAVFKSLFSTFTKGRGLPKWLTVVMWVIWFFNAFMNMFYTYACATAAYPFMLLGVALFWEEKNKKEMLRRQQTAQKEGLIRAKSEVDWN